MEKAEVGEERVTIERTTGNVFEALGLPDAEELAHKSDLVIEIKAVMAQRGLTQTAAAEIVGLDQPTLSKLLRGRTSNVSIGKLSDMLNALGRNVTIIVSGAVVGDGAAFERGHTGVVFVDGHFTVGRERVQGPAELVGVAVGS